MLIRALIVLLLVLNLGVALWWALRTPPPSEPAFEPDPQVPTLQLLAEAPAPAKPVEPATPEIDQCLSLGPFADADAAAQAAGQLQPQVLRLQQRREFPGTPNGWRVFLPPFASIESAEAAAARIADAGFADYYVIREGGQAGSLALGLYGNEESARARAASLREAGFPAQVEPTGAGAAQYWLDLGATADFEAPAAQAQVGAARRQPLDCAALEQRAPAGAT